MAIKVHPYLGMKIPDSHLQGVGDEETMGQPGVVEAVGADWCVIRVLEPNKVFLVKETDYWCFS